MLETQRRNHTVYRIAYHMCWIPKYRHEIFKKELQKRMKEILFQIAYEYEWKVHEMEVMTDHVHMLLETMPKWSPSRIIQTLKSKSAIQFFREYPEIKKKYFWGGKLWTSSYFVATVGTDTYESMKKYIEEQNAVLENEARKLKLL